MTETFTDPRDQAAYVAGLDAHAEARRLMGTPEYRNGDAATHARVRVHFAKAYGAGDAPVRTATGPGQVPASPFARG
jgi:hypothetical protein